MRVFVAFFIAAAVLAAGAFAQCDFGSGTVGVKMSDAMSCFNAVPFSSSRRSAVVTSLKELVSYYAFSDIATCKDCTTKTTSGAAQGMHNLNVDLRGSLSRISSKSYSSDYAFQKDVLSLMVKLYDAHTYYYYAAAYGQFFVIRPFIVQSDGAGGLIAAGQLEIGGTPWSTYAALAGVANTNTSSFVGKTITTINGMSATAYLQHVADDYGGLYKSPDVRFNAMLEGGFVLMGAGPGPFPSETTETYGFSDGTSYSSDLILVVVNAQDFSSPSSFANVLDSSFRPAEARPSQPSMPMGMLRPTDPYPNAPQKLREQMGVGSERPLVRPQQPNASQKDGAAKSTDLKVEGTSTVDHHPVSMRYVSPWVEQLRPSWTDDSKPRHADTMMRGADGELRRRGTFTVRGGTNASSDVVWGTYVETGAPVVVVQLKSFASTGPSALTYMSDYEAAIAQAIDYGQANSISKVIVDVSGNGGGYVCLSNAVLRMFFQAYQSNLYTVRQLYDYRLQNSAEVVARETDTRFAECSDSTITSATWGANQQTKSITYDSETSTYSGIWAFNCDSIYSDTLIDYTPSYFFANVIVMTDGTCGSACSQFTSRIMNDKLATVVSYGGASAGASSMDTSSFCGGNVLTWSDFATSYPVTNFPGATDGRFNFAEMYLSNYGIPREFLNLPANVHLNAWPELNLGQDGRDLVYTSILGLSSLVAQPSTVSCASIDRTGASSASTLDASFLAFY